MVTVMLMHFPAMRSSVQKYFSPAARAVRRRSCSVAILSGGDSERCHFGVAQHSQVSLHLGRAYITLL